MRQTDSPPLTVGVHLQKGVKEKGTRYPHLQVKQGKTRKYMHDSIVLVYMRLHISIHPDILMVMLTHNQIEHESSQRDTEMKYVRVTLAHLETAFLPFLIQTFF